MNACVEYHSKELYVENEERRFQRTRIGCTDTHERKKERRRKSEQDFLEGVEAERKYMRRNSSDEDIIERFKGVTVNI
jgi:hypothetical protein